MKEAEFVLPEKELRDNSRREGVSKFAVGAGIESEGRLLLVRRVPGDFLGGQYEFPGGGVDKKETLEEALRREVKEEVGLIVDKITGIFKGFDYVSDDGEHTRQFNFIVKVNNQEVTLNPLEHDSHAWVGLNDSPNLRLSKEITESIVDYFKTVK